MTARPFQTSALWIAGLLAAFAAVEACVRLAFPGSCSVLPPSRAISTLPTLFLEHGALRHTRLTLFRAVIVLCAATTLGVAGGVLLSASRTARFILVPIIDLVRPIPSVAIIPLLVLFLGFRSRTIMLGSTLGTMWPILITAYRAFTHRDASTSAAIAQVMLPPVKKFFRLQLPSVFPGIAPGIQVGSAVALILVFTAELMISNNGGIGTLMSDLANAANYPGTYACLLLLSVVGLSFNGAVSFVCEQSSWGKHQYEAPHE